MPVLKGMDMSVLERVGGCYEQKLWIDLNEHWRSTAAFRSEPLKSLICYQGGKEPALKSSFFPVPVYQQHKRKECLL
jgi:hypothetical protein